MKRNSALAVALIVGGIITLVVSSSSTEGVAYRQIREVRSGEQTGRVRLTGHLVNDTLERKPAERMVVFSMIDSESEVVSVHYRGVAPDTLRNGSEVVVSGKYDRTNGHFEADDLLAKCPSKYEGKYEKHVSEKRNY